ncbi:hypothetical protein [Paraburkholderia fungorum]|uniref:hypothetical protein n=1 Tax=Paraburkholderia fungorum TaxID=134537 RepID=UPI001614D193|nr:hypothetical protein [Paraburkholderia fungorum]MBB5546599.1 hypothetical protein [Paraburkholderia fungorum]
MSTIVIMPVSQSSTVEHQFRTTTVGGRELILTVTAMRDTSHKAVLEDVKKSLHPGAKIEPYDEPIGFGSVLFFWVIAWGLSGAACVVGAIIADMAGLVNMAPVFGSPSTWPTWLPLVGGLNVGPGLVRLWLVFGPALLAFMSWSWLADGKRDHRRGQ